jgi:poly(3-hydroxybutyrate) depolymerase
MRFIILLRLVTTISCAAFVAIAHLAAEPAALPRYNAAIGESSISGISSGAYMAIQFATAWSSIIKGVGVVAGGPFWCAQADAADAFNWYTLPQMNAIGPCMAGPPPDLSFLIAKADAKAASGDIDPLQNLKRQKVYLFHGYNDAVVAKSVTDAAADFYRHYLGEARHGNLYYQTAVGAGHSLVVLQQPHVTGLNNCTDNSTPFIDRCGYDQAGIILQHIYGALNPPSPGQLSGTMQRFDQSVYTKPHDPSALSLGDDGYVYVPKDCKDGATCRVHIALHGCKQDVGDIDRRFIDHTGYNSWADTNHFIVLYPQTRSSPFFPTNPQACWDWWSYIDHEDSYVTKSGSQIRAIKAMLDSLTAHPTLKTPTPIGVTVAPTGLAVIDTSDTGAALVWTRVEGATTYRIQRAAEDGVLTAIGDLMGPSFADVGLAPKSTYRWRVSAVVNGVEGPPSIEISATTRLTPLPCENPGTCPVSN